MYDQIARYYDWEHGLFTADIQLYLGFAAASRAGILDAACGTGRILVPLAEAGYRVTGVDSSPAMLAAARAKVGTGAIAKRARLVCADLRRLALRQRFDLILVGLGSFHHLATMADQRSALAGFAEHMVPGGVLILDLVNPAPEWLAAGDGALVHQLTAPFPDIEGSDSLSKFVARTVEFETQVDRQLVLYDRTSHGGAVARTAVQMEARFLFRYETELLLAEAGLRVRNIHGGYDLESYEASSPRMIIVAEK